ncbi:MAG: plasmid recombination protein [Ruminococcus sp.]|uniref:plasmid recombination protein n=1 Tax=Ruminococcus sp. TaxID=41978 RepID=UPI0025FED200|nr:plasmid recombination protein [Ruminococcus sp.]MCR4795682.1 plasmid recombination protein [Ruminococcus sp.]
MKQKRISFGQGKGSLTHNNREFMADNVDPLRTPQNITFVRQPIGEAYEQLFAESTARYNDKQKRNDRKVHSSYYEHLFGVKPCNTVRTAADKRKSFYEDVVQIGKMEDSGYGTEDFQLVADCLKEYMEGFQNRNPNFYVFNAVLHMDEATPHLHIDYIPVGHYKRGQDVQNGIAQALKEMGYGEGKMAIARWRAAEVEVLNAICLEHGIKPLAPEKARGTVEIPEYKEQRRQNDELAEQNAQIEAELSEKRSESEKLDQQIEEKSAQVKAILNYIPDYEKEFKIEDECEQLCRELTSLLDGKLSIMKHSDEIISKAQRLSKIMKKLSDSTHKSGDTVYALRERLDRSLKETEDVRQRLKQTSGECSELRRDVSSLQAEVDDLSEFVSLLKRLEPQKYAEVKQAQEYVHSQREQEVQQSATRKKKSWGLE